MYRQIYKQGTRPEQLLPITSSIITPKNYSIQQLPINPNFIVNKKTKVKLYGLESSKSGVVKLHFFQALSCT